MMGKASGQKSLRDYGLEYREAKKRYDIPWFEFPPADQMAYLAFSLSQSPTHYQYDGKERIWILVEIPDGEHRRLGLPYKSGNLYYELMRIIEENLSNTNKVYVGIWKASAENPPYGKWHAQAMGQQEWLGNAPTIEFTGEAEQ